MLGYDFDILSLSIGIAIGFIASLFLREAWLNRKINRLEAENEALDSELDTFKQKEWSTMGHKAKQEKAERMQAMIIEFAAAMKAPNANVGEVVKTVGAKYPDLIMGLLQKGLKL